MVGDKRFFCRAINKDGKVCETSHRDGQKLRDHIGTFHIKMPSYVQGLIVELAKHVVTKWECLFCLEVLPTKAEYVTHMTRIELHPNNEINEEKLNRVLILRDFKKRCEQRELILFKDAVSFLLN